MINEEIKVPAAHVPEGSRFKGYNEFIVQDLGVSSHNIKYLLECWQKPEGGYVIATRLRSWAANTSEYNLFASSCISTTIAMLHSPCCWNN